VAFEEAEKSNGAGVAVSVEAGDEVTPGAGMRGLADGFALTGELVLERPAVHSALELRRASYLSTFGFSEEDVCSGCQLEASRSGPPRRWPSHTRQRGVARLCASIRNSSPRCSAHRLAPLQLEEALKPVVVRSLRDTRARPKPLECSPLRRDAKRALRELFSTGQSPERAACVLDPVHGIQSQGTTRRRAG